MSKAVEMDATRRRSSIEVLVASIRLVEPKTVVPHTDRWLGSNAELARLGNYGTSRTRKSHAHRMLSP